MTTIIAEIGSNHDGSLERAQELISAAARSGADAAKFQLFNADELYPGRHTPGAVPRQWLDDLNGWCMHEGVDFLCSVFSLDTLDAYMDVEPSAIKIASPEATNPQLLEACASTGVPLLVSTGAMGWDDLDRTMHVLGDAEVTLLHCVSAYPAASSELNLRAIPEMRSRYGVPVGFSDHSLMIEPAVLAVAAGACVVEKHLTYSRSAPGPDHSFAVEPEEFAAMCQWIRDADVTLGDGRKRVMACEDPTDRRAA